VRRNPFTINELTINGIDCIRLNNFNLISLQHKKLTKSGEEKPINSPKLEETTNELDLDISNSMKNGILYLEDPIEKVMQNHIYKTE
jgi:hypothetical protein